MPIPRRSTRRREVRPLGVSERLGDAPPTRYKHNDARPKPEDTYTTDVGHDLVTHRFDGKCHPDCPNVR